MVFTNQQQKEGQGENLHPLLLVRGSIATKDEIKAVVLDAFFASVFNSQTSCPWEDRDHEQNEVPVIQEETVAIAPLKCSKVHGVRRNPPKPLSTICHESWLTKMAGGWPVCYPWSRRAGRRIQKTTGLSA